jgi:hypothetical protein
MSPHTQLWRAQAGVVAPPGSSGIPDTIHGITGDQLKSEAEARDYVSREAKKWVHERLTGRSGNP